MYNGMGAGAGAGTGTGAGRGSLLGTFSGTGTGDTGSNVVEENRRRRRLSSSSSTSKLSVSNRVGHPDGLWAYAIVSELSVTDMALGSGIALQYSVAVVDVSPLDVNYITNFMSDSLHLSCQVAATNVPVTGVTSFTSLLHTAQSRLPSEQADDSTVLLAGPVGGTISVGDVHSVPESAYFLRSNKETFLEKHSDILIGAMSLLTVALIVLAVASCVFPDATKRILSKLVPRIPRCLQPTKGGGYGTSGTALNGMCTCVQCTWFTRGARS
jgi:hypothetical protein